MRTLIFTNARLRYYVLLINSIAISQWGIHYLTGTMTLGSIVGGIIGAMIGASGTFLYPLDAAINGRNLSIWLTFKMYKNIPILFYRVVEFEEYDLEFKENKHEVRKWCKDQCEGKYVIGLEHAFFKKASDAAMFRLTQ